MKDLLYLTLVQCLEVFLGKIRDGSTNGKPIVHEDFVKEVNGTIGERLDGESKELANGMWTVPWPKGTVTMDMDSAIEHAIGGYYSLNPDTEKMESQIDSTIKQYYRLKADHEELDDWWNTASKLVPLLWD